MAEKIPALKKEVVVPRSRRGKKLLRILIALVAIVLIALFFRSPMSKISEVQVSGTNYVSGEDVKKSLGAGPGDSFFFPGVGKLKNNILALKPIESVSISKHFPGVVRVEVKEYPQVAVQLAEDGKVIAVLANGTALPIPEGKTTDKPILSGWKADDPNLAELCNALSALPAYLLADLSEIHPDPSNAYPKRIKLYTRSRFEVVTAIDKLQDKIPFLSDIVQNREPGKIIMLDADSYLPYSAENVTDSGSEAEKVKEKDSTQ
ncbi:cell division protein FtsQ/DivIB [Cohnella suwonensis]|uniref:Cell division protein DivIB n=1 Tax=Cohnella suwonensis TaxID=696072 RepID=A0ABW0LRG0_9BACL